MEKINYKIFLKQLFIKDLFGKDSHRGVSLTYAWLANQLGHFTLGFLPSIWLSLAFDRTYALVYSIGVSAFWILFEAINLLFPILFKKNKASIFKPKWKNLIYDTVTDVFYFLLGATFSCFLITFSTQLKIATFVVLAILFYPFIDWYSRRIYQQYAYFPFQFRLSQWEGDFLDNKEKNIVENYIDKSRTSVSNHLLIFGTVHEGKSNLGVAIANELALYKQTCTYTTATKLYSLFFNSDDGFETIWNWKTSKFLVIDDISPDKNQITTPTDFLNRVDTIGYEKQSNRNILKNKNVIWILGVHKKDENEEWSDMLNKIGVINISIVNLSY